MVRPKAPSIAPLRVKSPDPLIVVSAVRVIDPLAVADELLLLNNAPDELAPTPAKLMLLASVLPLRSNAPPDEIVTAPAPRAELMPTLT